MCVEESESSNSLPLGFGCIERDEALGRIAGNRITFFCIIPFLPEMCMLQLTALSECTRQVLLLQQKLQQALPQKLSNNVTTLDLTLTSDQFHTRSGGGLTSF